ncbi:hypothetical protein [Morganella morganii]|uniref:Uncharacterized protein n=1 Tax=bacterium 19GA11TI05 TaxID=2920688 RepID=A0AAU6TRG5_UNCXX|nr:hypothetical protein [Morganella morganii]MBT0422400.1 hypothetical protein [Morganella morganii subsp. morganii]MBT0516950.1 hypothetical protein [Morganella morganii subsp. morganii]MCU6355884.1 hypothetical protein [Morganella morganii]MDW7794097.1 hypothetical protein [Morganella morganii]MRE59551.1 hypothetical protein [Morganella morganii]
MAKQGVFAAANLTAITIYPISDYILHADGDNQNRVTKITTNDHFLSKKR